MTPADTARLILGVLAYALERARCEWCLGDTLCDTCPNWCSRYAGALKRPA